MLTVLSVFSGDLWAGAEVMIFNLLSELHRIDNLRLVALALNDGTLAQRLRTVPIETHTIPETQCSFPHILVHASRLLRGRPIDVIHSHGYKQNILAFFLSFVLHPTSLVATVHGLPEPEEGKRSGTPLPERLAYALLRHQFTYVIAVSNDIKHRLTEEHGVNPDRVSVIHNGLRCMDVSPSSTQDTVPQRRQRHVGSVGRLFPVKDYSVFLSAAAIVRRTCPDIRFSILGDGPLRNDLLAQSRQLGISECFEIFPPNPDPSGYYRTLDVYLNTSRHEGIPMSILEAMASAVPVVAPRVGGIPEVVSHGVEGLLVETRQPDDFARACSTLLADQPLRHTLGQNGRHTVAHRFSAAAMAARYQELYCSAANPAGKQTHD